MADRSAREIERDLEHKRSELSSTIDEIFDRMTLEGAWNYAGRYLRDHRSEHGQTVGNILREKPLAVGLVAIGMAWIVFGSRVSDQHSLQQEKLPRSDERDDVEGRARVGSRDHDDTSSRTTRTGSYTSPEAGVTPLEMPPTDPDLPKPGKTASSEPTSPVRTTPAGTQDVPSRSTGSTKSDNTRGNDKTLPPAAPAVVPASSPPRPPATTSSDPASKDNTTGVGSSKTPSSVSPSVTKSSDK
ncbi:hypothetical protein PARU111607_16305 [Palleronia rufa]